jgi:hypothetical protein
LSFVVTAQNQTAEDLPNPFEVLTKYTKQNNYITPIFELKAKEEKYLASPQWKTVYLEMMILLQTKCAFLAARRDFDCFAR